MCVNLLFAIGVTATFDAAIETIIYLLAQKVINNLLVIGLRPVFGFGFWLFSVFFTFCVGPLLCLGPYKFVVIITYTQRFKNENENVSGIRFFETQCRPIYKQT